VCECNGTGKCQSCGGSGVHGYVGFGEPDQSRGDCNICDGSGECRFCFGELARTEPFEQAEEETPVKNSYESTDEEFEKFYELFKDYFEYLEAEDEDDSRDSEEGTDWEEKMLMQPILMIPRCGLLRLSEKTVLLK
jgi:hypothetical protein